MHGIGGARTDHNATGSGRIGADVARKAAMA
jgi:hypothetical protein